MRRITRRIGLFGGPGAMVNAAGGKTRNRPTSEAKIPETPPEAERPDEPVPEKRGWFDWLRGPKKD